jgi:hypothetical protein
VHVVTRYKEFEHWKSFIEDHKIYVLYNCQVYDNDAGFKPCEGPFKIVLGSGTNVKPAPEITKIPDKLFWFKKFKEVHDGVLSKGCLPLNSPATTFDQIEVTLHQLLK